MMDGLITRLRTWLTEKPIAFDPKRYHKLAQQIGEHEAEKARISDTALRQQSAELSERVQMGAPRAEELVEGFALVREAARRAIGLWAYDTQLRAALAMYDGHILQLDTGEGKTLVAVFPAYLRALEGRGVHVLTFNDYLARRDAVWMGPVFEQLGLTVAAVQQSHTIAERQAAYRADVTYTTAREVGFDYLRDGQRLRVEELVLPPPRCAIVDEADSLLVDEARVPLVIAGARSADGATLLQLPQLVRDLAAGRDYETDEAGRNAYLTDSGLAEMERSLASGPLHEPEQLDTLTRINLALHAEALLKRDVDYIVRDGRVELVDEFTGRVVEERRWPDGLQAALEAKEGLRVADEGDILGSITLQHLLRLYDSICGMTATAQEAADEFQEFYDCRMVVIPPNRPCQRCDHADVIYSSRETKERAIVAEVRRLHGRRQPVLVGTASVAESERIANALASAGIDCQVLNAKNDEHEADVIAQAGALAAVTISTNMAGRGTDIRLGGADQRDAAEVAGLGGLFVIGTNRHESRRIDRQLRGRSGRQGDPGESRFILSLDDDLIQRFGGAPEQIDRLRKQSETPLTAGAGAGRAVARAQDQIEIQNLEIRRSLFKFSRLVEEQRQHLRQRRDDVLHQPQRLELCRTRVSERYQELCEELGPDAVVRAEQRITLHHLDHAWTGHLAHIRDIREGIHLHGMSAARPFSTHLEPVDVFHRQVGTAFRNLLERIDEEIAQSFAGLQLTGGAIDLQASGIQAPAATWTYMINEYPLGLQFAQFFKGLFRLLRRESKN